MKMNVVIKGNQLIIGNRTILLSEGQLKSLTRLEPFERGVDMDGNEKFFMVDYNFDVVEVTPEPEMVENCYNVGNYCHDKDRIRSQAVLEELHRKLWKFSVENYKKNSKKKRNISYVINTMDGMNFFVSSTNYTSMFDVHFQSKSLAERAIREVVIPFMKEKEITKINAVENYF